MSHLQADFFSVECLSNTLVGSGKANYGVIDQLVQRDTATHIPVIHASGLKGAIKEFCTNQPLMPSHDIMKVFGSVKNDNEHTATGKYKFLDAHLLSIPIRSDKRAFVYITCPMVIENLVNQLKIFSRPTIVNDLTDFSALIKNNDIPEAYCFTDILHNAILEDFEFSAKYIGSTLKTSIEKLFSTNIILTSNYIFQTLTNDLHLPVIARNYLNNGESENLWYEQVIPRKSRFWFVLLKPTTEKVESFDSLLVANDSVIQIGANATVGYGYTKINLLNVTL